MGYLGKLIGTFAILAYQAPSSQAKGTNSTSFLTHARVRNEVELVPLACEDDQAPSLFTSIWDIAFWFGLMLNALVSGYGHVGTVNSPLRHTFFLG